MGAPAKLALSLLLVCLVVGAMVSAKKDRSGVPAGHREDVYCSACRRVVKHLVQERDHFLKTAAVVRGNDSQKREKIYNKKQLNIEQIEVIAHLEDKVDSSCDATEIYKDKLLKRSCRALLDNHDEAAVEHIHQNIEDEFCEATGACLEETAEYFTQEEKEDQLREKKELLKSELRSGWLSDDSNNVITEIESDEFHTKVMEGNYDTFAFFYRADVEGAHRDRNKAAWAGYTDFAALHRDYRDRVGDSPETVRFVVMEQVTNTVPYDLGITDFSIPVVALFPEKRRNDPVVMPYEDTPIKQNEVLRSMLDALSANASNEDSKKEAESLSHDINEQKTDL